MNLLQPGLTKAAMERVRAVPHGKKELRAKRDQLLALREAKDRDHRNLIAKVDQVLADMDAVLGELRP